MKEKVYYILLRHKLCMACKKKLPDDYIIKYCCSGYQCGCYGLPIDPWACCKICEDIASENNWNFGNSDWPEYSFDYRYMWR